ncbi:MAG: tyrosine--tRNA ligase [Actinomycetota bacterium]
MGHANADPHTLTADAAEVIPLEELERKLALGRPLRVKLGLDPTAEHVTLGWAVVLRKLRQFQDAGHTAVLIVGDFTARVGDPSGKSETRPRLEVATIQAFAARVLEQFSLILDRERLEVRYNSEWLEPLTMEDVLGLTSRYTVARMLERDDFAKRYADGRPISVMEFLYPLMQAYDSVAVRADIELGGTDQTFNLLVGREIQRDYGQEPQVALTMPLLEGLDGVQKMSQSLGNYVGITEPPEEMFGKLMRIPDALIPKYLELCGGAPAEEAAAVRTGLEDGSVHPARAKRDMAARVVALYHGPDAGSAAEARFDTIHVDHEIPDDVPSRPLPAGAVRDGRVWIVRLLVELDLAKSNSEGRRLIEGGGVRVDGAVVADPTSELDPGELAGRVVQVGPHRFVRVEG